MESIRRGDVDQMSFGFRTKKDEWDDTNPNNIIRTLVEVELFDVSPVTYPAYPATSIGVRSAKEIFEAHSAAQASIKTAEIEARRAQARLAVQRRKLELLQKL